MKFPSHASLDSRQHALSEALRILPDESERLNVLVAHAAAQAGLSEEERQPERLVMGCVSQVWLLSAYDGRVCSFRSAADSALVAGLVGAMAQVCSGLPPAELSKFHPSFLESCGLWSQLSPTRQRGLRAVAKTIQAFALACC